MNRVAFAALAAQIIPVLMLTLVVEWRSRARILTRKAHVSKNRRIRWLTSLGYFLAACLMFSSLMSALRAVIDGEISELDTSIIYGSIFVSALLLFLLPVTNVAFGLSIDVVGAAMLANPFGRASRLIRRRADQADRGRSALRGLRGARLEARAMLAGRYIQVYQRYPVRDLALTFQTRKKLDQYQRDLDEYRGALDAARIEEAEIEAEMAEMSSTVEVALRDVLLDVSVVRAAIRDKSP